MINQFRSFPGYNVILNKCQIFHQVICSANSKLSLNIKVHLHMHKRIGQVFCKTIIMMKLIMLGRCKTLSSKLEAQKVKRMIATKVMELAGFDRFFDEQSSRSSYSEWSTKQLHQTETYSEPGQTSKMERLVKIVHGLKMC